MRARLDRHAVLKVVPSLPDENPVDRLVLSENALNGGFPEPPVGAPVRIVAAHHDACGASTRVRLPGSLPTRAVRRFHCAGCAAAFEAESVEELELRTANGQAPSKPAKPAPVRPAPVEREPVPLEVSLMGLIKSTGPAVAPEPVVVEREPVVIPESELVVVGPEQDAIEALTVEVPAAKAKRRARPKRAGAKPKGSKSRLVTALTAKRSLSKPKLSMPKLTLPKGPKLSAPSLPAISLPTLKRPSLTLPSLDPESRSWKLLSIPIAAVLVIIGLIALRGGSEEPTIAVAPPAAEATANHAAGAAGGGKDQGSGGGDNGASKPSKDTQFVSESLYSLAMPAGWQRIDPPSGATFAAVAADGGADATLWIKEDPKLDYPTFVSRSLTQLETLAGDAEIVERVPGPTAESTVVRLAADAPPGMPSYEVTLRVAGPYRYYLATSVQPDATAEAADGADLVAGSLTPELEG